MVTSSVIVLVPAPVNVTSPGSAVVSLAGKPPWKVHLYVNAVSPQLKVVAAGLMVTGPQALGTALRVTWGGLFTATVLVVVNDPQGLVSLSVMV